MIEQDFDKLLSEAVDAVLETMFFTAPLGPAEPETSDSVLEAGLTFHGLPSGTLSVRLSEASAVKLAAGFLGQDEETLTDSQPGQVVCELANMLCGSLVSQLESEERFDLDPPELILAPSDGTANQQALPAARQSFELENGILTVTLHVSVDA